MPSQPTDSSAVAWALRRSVAPPRGRARLSAGRAPRCPPAPGVAPRRPDRPRPSPARSGRSPARSRPPRARPRGPPLRLEPGGRAPSLLARPARLRSCRVLAGGPLAARRRYSSVRARPVRPACPRPLCAGVRARAPPSLAPARAILVSTLRRPGGHGLPLPPRRPRAPPHRRAAHPPRACARPLPARPTPPPRRANPPQPPPTLPPPPPAHPPPPPPPPPPGPTFASQPLTRPACDFVPLVY